MTNEIIIHEVGPRDGLQVEKAVVPKDQKIKWIESLMDAGIKYIQVGSFVHPVKMPQMADSDEMFKYFSQPGKKPDSVVLSGLVLNEKGMDRGMACGVDLFCMGVSASETHSQKNTRMTTAEATERIGNMAKEVLKSGKKVQASVQSAFGCGFEGPIPVENVVKIIEKYLELGVKNISLADTAGHAHPALVEQLFEKILALDPTVELACHFHNTYGLGLANCYAAMRVGVKFLEASFGGLGGCPFTKLPSGNVSTEDLVHSLQRDGKCTDLNLPSLIEIAKDVSNVLDHELPGFVMKSGSIVNYER
ncbi:MAG: hydroxymethylglutaryl-CoA lyase [bacterium]|nr:hydroxymethylglutaryl-CoA lyase [bacterium]